ncbi:MAG TPA: hypothetical protein VHW24_25010, partial [Bryobacteraceae bacterium]|nr:hypothetical protein [Bryobacteraceae bacterium]
ERLSRSGVRIVCAVIVLAFTVRAFARNFDWYTPESLFTSAERTVPESFRPHHVLAGIYQTAGKLEDAIHEADQSTRILSSLPDDQSLALPWVTAASIYAAKASSLSTAEAATWWNKALDAVHRARQIAVAQDARVRRIDAEYGKPYHAADTRMIYENLGYVEMRTRNFDRSIEAIKTAMQQGLSTNTFINLATDYRDQGDQRNAEITLLEGMLWGKDNSFGSRLVELYRQGDSENCAIRSDGNSVGLNTACPLVRSELCDAAARLLPLLESQGQTADAAHVRAQAAQWGCGR